MPIQTLNPATGKVIKSFDEPSIEEIHKIIDKSDKAFQSWRSTSFDERKKLMLNAADVLRKGKRKYGEILTLEMGKLLREAEAEVEKCAWVCEHYAGSAESMLSEEQVKTDASKSYIRFDPLGVILAVMPWNFPFWQVFRFAAPALMAGNAGLLKHASNVPQCALALEEIFLEAGFPGNVFKTLLISSSAVKYVIDNPLVKAATLTGSEFAGKQVAEACGRKLKKSVMEPLLLLFSQLNF